MAGMSVQIDGEIIKRVTARKCMFIGEIAAASGLGKNTVYHAVKTGRCGLRVARAIAGAIGMKPAQIIKFPEDQRPSTTPVAAVG
jgi:hypothetical protein